MTDGAAERFRYQKDIAELEPNHPWFRIRDRIPPGASVLDVGCGSGELAIVLTQRSDRIDGVEPSPERAAVAGERMRRVYVGMAGPELDDEIAERYDIVVFSDVLEHFADPLGTLRWAASKLAPGGEVVVLIPNSANWRFRKKMLLGDWSYHDTGYFDRDHLRFFDTRTIRQLGEAAGLTESSFDLVPEGLPPPLHPWAKGAELAARVRPNLFAGHVLISWRAG